MVGHEALEDVAEEQGEQVAGHGGAEDADVAEHVDEAGPLRSRLRPRERLAEEHQGVDGGRDEVQGELVLPVPVQFVVQVPARHGAEHHAGRPTGVKDVEVMRAVVGEDRGHERVGDSLERAVGEREDEGTPEQQLIGVVRGGGAEGDQSREDVTRQCERHELAVADLVDDHAADDDPEAEAGESGAGDLPHLRGGEAELLPPVVEDAAADREAHARREDRHEARPEQAVGVGIRPGEIGAVLMGVAGGHAWVPVGRGERGWPFAVTGIQPPEAGDEAAL